MRTEYKRDMNHNYLVIYEDIELDTSSYQVRMLVGNVMPSLLKCQFHGVDGKIVFRYDITSKQSLSVLYDGRLLKEDDLRLIFGSFIHVMEEMAEYLLNPGNIILQPEYVYMDVNRKEIFYCYLPGAEREIREQLQILTEYLLPKIDHSDEKAVMLGYSVYRRTMEESFHLEHIKEELFRGGIELEKDKVKRNSNGSEKNVYEGKSDISVNKESIVTEDRMREIVSLSEDLQVEENDLEALFDSVREETKRTKGTMQQKIYIIVPIVGTIFIMAILAANMIGILPWLRVEILLIAVVLLSMLVSLICYLAGKIQGKKKREENDREWKEKVAKFKAEKKEEKRVCEEIENSHKENYDTNNIFYGNRETKWSSQKECGETVVLSAAAVRGPASFVSREPGELATIYLKDDLTVIGKLETAADAVIALPTISRLHAKVRKKEEDYYLADLNSRNGTSVNGRMLKVNEEYLLQDEDEVDFAEARYVFLK